MNMKNGTAMNATSECGFNKSPDAWCPAHKGDEFYMETWEKFVNSINKSKAWEKCNPLSRGSNNKYGCVELQTQTGEGFFKKFRQAEYVVSAFNAWPNVADNDFCVKKMITSEYWFEGNAMMATISAVFITLFMLF